MAEASLILIVDDDRESRELLSRFLTKHGYRVETVPDGLEMWRALDVHAADLIVLDW